MGLRPAYPKAEGNYQKYKQVYDNLVRLQGDGRLQTAANATIPVSGDFQSSTCEGDYYDSYEKQMEVWRTDAQNIKNKFISANSDLQTRISSAKSLRDYWDRLRHVMADDGKE